jgi:hypothetical protein
MARPGGRTICENCRSIDVRRWHREGLLQAGQLFPYSWQYGEEPFGGIRVSTEADAAILMFRAKNWQDSDWKDVEQRVLITWTECHLGGRRPWFVCPVFTNGRFCGRRVALLYGAGELFACRHCYNLAYASQQEALRFRGLGKARKIRMRLGGGPNLLDKFPSKPRGMHWRTYDRLCHAYDVLAGRLGLSLARAQDAGG